MTLSTRLGGKRYLPLSRVQPLASIRVSFPWSVAYLEAVKPIGKACPWLPDVLPNKASYHPRCSDYILKRGRSPTSRATVCSRRERAAPEPEEARRARLRPQLLRQLAGPAILRARALPRRRLRLPAARRRCDADDMPSSTVETVFCGCTYSDNNLPPSRDALEEYRGLRPGMTLRRRHRPRPTLSTVL